MRVLFSKGKKLCLVCELLKFLIRRDKKISECEVFLEDEAFEIKSNVL